MNQVIPTRNTDPEVQVRIVNISNQMIPLQVSAVGEDFFRGQQQLHLQPGKDVLINEKYLVKGQTENLAKRGMLRLITNEVG